MKKFIKDFFLNLLTYWFIFLSRTTYVVLNIKDYLDIYLNTISSMETKQRSERT